MLTPRETAFATPADLGGSGNYRRLCRKLNLNAVPDGYGLILATDENGNQVTLCTGDVEYVRAIAGASPEVLAGLELPADKFLTRDGWPESWA
ncbi:hypothetical protein [Streptomyces sp. NPDC058620]|uniref:hypothetical protein n=1 Tax=Streptomyces sp. NPDC058620 TaxID=3346560 RepID=UPI00365B48DE